MDYIGWISIHRKIQNHWIYPKNKPFSNFEAWIDILLSVNHAENKTVIKGTIYEIKRGESIFSLDTWSKRWSWNKSKVRRFLNVLQKDNMIVLKNETQTTRLKVCNYGDYQNIRNANETQTKRKRNANETQTTPNNNDNNSDNDNNDIKENIIDRKLKFSSTLKPYLDVYGKDLLNDFFLYWTEPNKSNTKFRAELEKTWSLERRLSTWAKNDKTFNTKNNGTITTNPGRKLTVDEKLALRQQRFENEINAEVERSNENNESFQ